MAVEISCTCGTVHKYRYCPNCGRHLSHLLYIGGWRWKSVSRKESTKSSSIQRKHQRQLNPLIQTRSLALPSRSQNLIWSQLNPLLRGKRRKSPLRGEHEGLFLKVTKEALESHWEILRPYIEERGVYVEESVITLCYRIALIGRQDKVVFEHLLGKINVTEIKIDTSEAYPPYQTFLRNRPIVGYRTWKLAFVFMKDGLRPFLTSHATAFVWTGPIQRNSEKPIIRDRYVRGKLNRNLFGFYTKRSAADAVDHFSYNTNFGAIGQISMFGRVIEHKKGFRAQHVRVDHIILLMPKYNIERGMTLFVDMLSRPSIFQGIPGDVPLATMTADELIKENPRNKINTFERRQKKVYDIKPVVISSEVLKRKLEEVYHCEVMLMPIDKKEQVRHYYEFMESEEDPDV